MNVVLYHPQIPQNTGNIARTCALTGSVLHLIKPLGFSISDKNLKRAGLDYWDSVDVRVYDDFDAFMCCNETAQDRMFIFSSKASQPYTHASFRLDDYLIFGSETAGLPQEIHKRFDQRRLKIPMRNHPSLRCLNLSNSVSIALYEAFRQNDFMFMQ